MTGKEKCEQMEAVILAGGKGTRLQSVVADVPKPMAPVNGKPFLEYIMCHLSKSGIHRVILSVGYKFQCIVDYFQNRYLDISLEYVIEDIPLGTGGAIKASLKRCQEERIFVINGDTFFDVDYTAMYRFSEKENAPLVMAVKEMENFNRYGCLSVANNSVVGFHEKEFCRHGIINGGVYCMKSDVLECINGDVFSFERDFLEKHCDELNISAFVSQGHFVDIGVPEDYLAVQNNEYFRCNYVFPATSDVTNVVTSSV